MVVASFDAGEDGEGAGRAARSRSPTRSCSRPPAPYGITHTPTADVHARREDHDAPSPDHRRRPGDHAGARRPFAGDGRAGPAAIYPYTQIGKLRAIASWGVKPHPAFPDRRRCKSMGFKDIEAYLWVGLFTRGGRPGAALQPDARADRQGRGRSRSSSRRSRTCRSCRTIATRPSSGSSSTPTTSAWRPRSRGSASSEQ